jgi:hypothetical protein
MVAAAKVADDSITTKKENTMYGGIDDKIYHQHLIHKFIKHE